jgi:hypothetical protein
LEVGPTDRQYVVDRFSISKVSDLGNLINISKDLKNTFITRATDTQSTGKKEEGRTSGSTFSKRTRN